MTLTASPVDCVWATMPVQRKALIQQMSEEPKKKPAVMRANPGTRDQIGRSPGVARARNSMRNVGGRCT
jgi:hypothetical protein